ncbi:hypothetical protein [Vibrio caribbeanicus]|uniref:hypothetical protein n=1 Tax=Vibrio caribbeanicus TaxID=701175 RepID=UPI0030DD0A6E
MKRRFWGMFTTKAKPFSNRWDEFRSEIKVTPVKDPRGAIASVSDDVLSLRTGYHHRRNTMIVPWMLVFSVLGVFLLHDFIPDLDDLENQAHERLDRYEENRRKGKPISYVQAELEPYSKALLNEEGKVTFYTYYRAMKVLGELDFLHSNFRFLVSVCAISFLLWLVFLFKPLDAEIYFDRKRKIVYTWRHGKVGAAYFDKMGLIENHLGINLVLQFENRKQNGYRPMIIVGIDAGKMVYNRERDTGYLLAQILAFMDHGKEAIITENSYRREPIKYFLRADKQPINLAARIDAALEAEGDLVEHYQKYKSRGHGF